MHTVKLKPIIKAQISGKFVTSGITDVVTASVHSENLGEEVDYDNYYWASEASPTQGCSIEISCDIYSLLHE